MTDGTEIQVGGITSSEAMGTSTQTYTEEQIQAAERKGRSDALADVNRTLAEAKKYKGAGEAAEARVTQMIKDYEEEIKDDPDKLSAFRQRQAKQKAETELANVRLELDLANERLTSVDAEKAELAKAQIINEVAGRFNVDQAKLARMAKFTDGTAAAIEEVARDLPPLKPGLKVPSGRSVGGSLTFTAEQVADRDFWEANKEAILLAQKEGRIKK